MITKIFNSNEQKTGNLVSGRSWESHPLGCIENWPHSLKISLGIIFNSKHPMCLFWGEEAYFFYNDGYLPIVGIDKEVWALGKRSAEVWAEVWEHHLKPQLEKSIVQGKSSWFEDQLIPILQNGELKDCYFTYSNSPVFDENDEIVGAIAVCTETTQAVYDKKKIIEDHMQAEIARQDLHNYFMQSPVPMVILEGPDHFVALANPGYESFVGRKVLGKTIHEAFPDGEAELYLPFLDDVFRTGNPFVGKELPVALPDENKVPKVFKINLLFSPFRDSTGKIKGVLALILDVTHDVETRLALEKSIADLENERELRERFVAAITHDLKTPLTSTKLSAQILLRDFTDNAKINKSIGLIIKSMNRADDMIQNILDASRIKARQELPLNFEKCYLNELLQAILGDFSSTHGDRFFLNSEEKIQGYWDKEAVRRMIENLANNAVKYGSNGTPITLNLTRNEKSVLISVHNEGNPIPSDDHSMIFEQFKRSGTSKNLQGGWGIGLTLVRGFARAHGGDVSLNSSLKLGTEFTISLPFDSRNP